VEALARGCVKLRKFSSKGCKQINDNAIMCLAKYCPDLMVLNLHSCEVGLHFVQILLHYNCLLLIADHKRFIDPATGRLQKVLKDLTLYTSEKGIYGLKFRLVNIHGKTAKII